MEDRRTPGQRAGLSEARVIAAARELLAEGGSEALTMRALAGRLGVAPNALYSHVASKTALIDQVLDAVLADVEAPPADAPDAAEGLRALMTSTYGVLLAHPDLVPLYLARRGARGADARRLGDLMLALLARAGVTGPDAAAALCVLIVYTIGFAAFAVRPPLEPEERPHLSGDELRQTFDRGLRWLLSGVTLDGRAGPPG